MESSEFSMLSSLRGEFKSEDYIQPHYKESYRLAIDRLVSDGRDSYLEFLKGERIGSFLSEEELLFITSNAQQPPPQTYTEEIVAPSDGPSSSGTYWPMHSDVETPDLDLGWPDFPHDQLQTNIDLLFHPPRQNTPSIKEVIRKLIQEARQVIAIVMDMFTDVDIFKEVVDASARGVPVYVLLDHSHLKGFLSMAENHDVKIQQLRNMRVRTVKGHDYLCRSGAKFHGEMGQKFLLVDCHTAIYGSYSFTWSFEKINLSMVQVIKGHLVKLYDEEFRTLYARSTVPAELCPPEGLSQRNGLYGQQNLPMGHSGQKIERRDLLRHTLDTVYRKTCERKLGMRNLEERLLEEEPHDFGPLIENGIGVQNQISQFQSAEAMNLLKRHSYAGERQDPYMPENIRPRASQWNISRDTGNGTNNYAMNNYLHVPQTYRGDQVNPSIQKNVPTLENTSKSYMRTLRIESYLKNPDVPFGDSSDYLDQFEAMDKAQGRTRSSFVFRSNIADQMEPNRHMNSTNIVSSAAPNTPMHYTSMQWNPTAGGDNRMNDEFMMKRQSLQILDDNRYNACFSPGKNSYPAVYASLGRNKGGHMLTNPDILADGWHKRHSLADPRSSTECTHDNPGHMYGGFPRMQVNKSTMGLNAQNGAYISNLNEEQRSVSHYDVKNITGTKGPCNPNWQEPPSRTLSAVALDMNRKDLTGKSNSRDPQHFSQRSATKITSLLNIPEKKEDLAAATDTLSLKSCGSTDTITAEDETPGGGGKHYQNTTNFVRSSSEHQRSRLKDDHIDSSKTQLTTEEPRHTRHLSLPKTSRQKKPAVLEKSAKPSFDADSWKRNKGPETRLYSRFEPFCSFEKKAPTYTPHTTHTQEKNRGLPKVEAATGHGFTRTARGHHENKLEKFFQRVGNLIHKNK
ncbi:hypothetical protein JOB18_040806 [Solea senegalensis]|nr:protein FAM83B [Solea senegalensis]XP_043902598.1 protein FAM83B [Solea senegalensis]KAG7512831.1 hypothetical protein JOB18_040806 [Solea senegalensis]